MPRLGGSGEPPPPDDEQPREERQMDVNVRTHERYYQLEGVIFRVRMDRLDQGAEYLRRGRWVWTPITSGSVIGNPHSAELSPHDAEPYRMIR
jgi:hypothetical protein